MYYDYVMAFIKILKLEVVRSYKIKNSSFEYRFIG